MKIRQWVIRFRKEYCGKVLVSSSYDSDHLYCNNGEFMIDLSVNEEREYLESFILDIQL